MPGCLKVGVTVWFYVAEATWTSSLPSQDFWRGPVSWGSSGLLWVCCGIMGSRTRFNGASGLCMTAVGTVLVLSAISQIRSQWVLASARAALHHWPFSWLSWRTGYSAQPQGGERQLSASHWRFSGHVQVAGDPRGDPEHAEGIISRASTPSGLGRPSDVGNWWMWGIRGNTSGREPYRYCLDRLKKLAEDVGTGDDKRSGDIANLLNFWY